MEIVGMYQIALFDDEVFESFKVSVFPHKNLENSN